MFVVDTNVLVYAANPDVEEYPPCRELVERWRGEASPWFITWGILYEFLRVITHPKVASEPWTAKEAWHFVTALVASPGLTVLTETERHTDVAAQVVGEVPALRGNLMHDAHTAILMREHGLRRIYTRDMDFHRFPFLEVIDPLASRRPKT